MPHGLHRHRPPRRCGLLLAGAVAAALCTPLAARAQSESALMVKLTLSLTRFAHWPAGAGGEVLRVCLAQRDAAISQAFAEVDGQVINGRRVQVVKAPPVAGCHVLFVHASAERAPGLIRSAAGDPVLIVGDAGGTLAMGGMVEFVPVNDSIRFDVNLAALRQSQMTVSSQVLKLARQVRE